jgi:hypothetical protein
VALARAALPVLAILVFAGLSLVILATAGGTWGYDYQAYAHAAQRLLDSRPLYDPAVDLAGGFAIYLYPPPFAVAFVPFVLLGDPAGLYAWTALLIGCTVAAVALMPVSVPLRWAMLLLAGLSWPFLYSLKLGQVGPILLLLFAIGWRWLDDPIRLGLSTALGAAIKLQPGIVFVWALLTRRWAAIAVGVVALAVLAVTATVLAGPGIWSDFVTLVRQVGDPIATGHNFTPGAIAYQLGVPSGLAATIQLISTVVVLGAVVVASRMATAEAGYLVAVIASQLLSPVLWDHYAMLLLLPVAYLCAAGRWWALAIPLVTATPLVEITPPIAYPIVFFVALGATLGVGIQARQQSGLEVA